MRISRSALAGSAAAIAMLCGQPAIADEPAAGAPLWGSHVDFEGRWGGDRNLGEADLFLPLWQDGRALLFGDIRTRLDNQGSREGNVGIGYRRMLDNGWNIGGYGFFDLRRTDDDNLFRQATLGVEALSFDWDFRANAYLPLGDTSKSLPSTTSDPYAELHSGTIQVVTPGVTLREEQAMAGFDVEVGRRVPVFPADSGTQLRAYAGFYHFSADGAEDVTGPRLRLELTVNEVPALWPGARLTLGAELQHDDVRDTQGFLLARLRVPLYDVKDRPRLPAPVSPRTHQIRRMTDPIVRDIDIVAQPVITGQTPEQREFAVDPRTGLPYATIETVDAATVSELDMRNLVNSTTNGIIILNGEFTVTDRVEMAEGQTLIGGGGTMPVQGETSGTIVSFIAPGTPGSLTGNLSAIGGPAAIIRMDDNSAVRGLTIENTSPPPTENGVGIDASAENVVIVDNTITTAGINGFGIYRGYGVAGDSTVIGNTITTSGENATAINFVSTSNDIASGNIITTSGENAHGIRFLNAANSTASGNTITTSGDAADGIYFDQSDNGVVSGNVIATSGASANGATFDNSDDGTVSDNTITTSGSGGINLFNSHYAMISGNTIASQLVGIQFANSDFSEASGNTVSTAIAGYGAMTFNDSESVTIRDNSFGPIAGDILMFIDDSSFISANSTGNAAIGPVGGQTCAGSGVATGSVSFTDGTVCTFP